MTRLANADLAKCRRRQYSFWTTCNCETCRPERLRTMKAYRCGLTGPRASTEDAWERLAEWTNAGFEPTWISSATGLSERGIASALDERSSGHLRRFGPIYAAKILAADIETGTKGRRSALGSQRRLQALARMGWTVEQLGDESGMSFVTLAAIQRGATQTVGYPVWAGIDAMYNRLQSQPGPSERASRRAVKRGWVAPMAWDDIDDPNEAPARPERDRTLVDEVKVRRVLDGHFETCNKAEKAEVIRRWEAAGKPLNELYRATGWNVHRERKRGIETVDNQSNKTASHGRIETAPKGDGTPLRGLARTSGTSRQGLTVKSTQFIPATATESEVA